MPQKTLTCAWQSQWHWNQQQTEPETMAKKVNILTAKEVEAAQTTGVRHDGGGLYLSVRKSGARSWAYRFMLQGKRREMGLGKAGKGGISLADARRAAGEARNLVRAGKDPIEEYKSAKAAAVLANAAAARKTQAITFGECADNYLRDHKSDFRNSKHFAQWEMTLTNYAEPLWNKPVNDVTTDDVRAVLKPHWARVPETAARLRGRIERVLDAAKAAGHREGENPARWKGHLDSLLSKPQKLTRGSHAAMPYKDVKTFMVELRDRTGIAAQALEFLILTAARSGEVRLAQWSEIDLAEKVWAIPAIRMKAGKEHRVPLTSRAVELLQAAKALADTAPPSSGALVFPGAKKDAPMSDMTLAAVIKRMKLDTHVTAHGFRSTFRDWAGDETDFAWDVIETALAHTVGNATTRAYRRSDGLEKRRRLMECWAEYCGEKTQGKNIVPP